MKNLRTKIGTAIRRSINIQPQEDNAVQHSLVVDEEMSQSSSGSIVMIRSDEAADVPTKSANHHLLDSSDSTMNSSTRRNSDPAAVVVTNLMPMVDVVRHVDTNNRHSNTTNATTTKKDKRLSRIIGSKNKNNNLRVQQRHSSADERIKALLSSSTKTKTRTTNPFQRKDSSKAPPKPKKNRSFKIDGIPLCVSKQIVDQAQKEQEQRRKSQHDKVRMEDLQGSFAQLQMHQERQRHHRDRFLQLPKGHFLFWDKSELAPADFPGDERTYLAKLLKTPHSKTRHGQSMSSRIVNTLKNLRTSPDWDLTTLGQLALVVFSPQRNPLDLSPAVVRYFYKRILAIKIDLEDNVEIVYNGLSYYGGGDTAEELYQELRKDFLHATEQYEIPAAYHVEDLYTT